MNPMEQLAGLNMYRGGMDNFWDQYRQGASNFNQDQIDFDAQKSRLMNPEWVELLARRSGRFDPRTFGTHAVQTERPNYTSGGLIGDTMFYSGTDPRTGGVDPNKGGTYSGPQFQPAYRRG